MVFRTQFGPRNAVRLGDFGPSRTKESFKEAADVNSVLARYAKTGVWSRTAREAMFGDVSFMVDYHTALSRVREAAANVDLLPGAARLKYREDPEGFLEAALSAAERVDLEALGLLEPLPAEPVVEAPGAP